MSHQIAKVNGADAFVYNKAGGKAWHGLGNALDEFATYEDWKLAVAGFNVEEVPLTYTHNSQVFTAPAHKGLLRPDTGLLLSIMSKQYKTVQPGEILDFYRDYILQDERFRLETAGLTNGGRKFWAVARFHQTVEAGGDEHICYVMFTTSFDGSLSTTAQAVLIRVVCENTWAMSQAGAATIRIPHNVNFQKAAVQQDCVDRLSSVAAGFDQYKVMADALAQSRLAYHQVEGLFKRLTIDKAAKGDAAKEEAPSTKARNQLAALLQAHRDTLAEGTPKDTAWAALNAVTRFVDHERNSRSTTGDSKAVSRMSSAMWGSGATLKREALTVLAEISNIDLAAITA